MENLSNKNNIKKEPKKTKKLGDVLFGIFLIILGFFIFVTFTFTIIISKIKEIPKEKYEQMPSFIKFLINDKHYCFCLTLSIPIIIIVSAFKRILFGHFRHSY